MTVIVLGGTGVRLAEAIAVHVPRVPDGVVADVRIELGAADLEDGQDESYVHARIVELLDAVLARVPAEAVTLVGFPPVPTRFRMVRELCNASADATAALRGVRFEPRSARPAASVNPG